MFELSRKCGSSSTDSEVPVFIIIMEMLSERTLTICNAESSKEYKRRFDQEEAEMTGAPDEKIEALVIFLPELTMLLRPVGKLKKGARKDPFQ